MDTLRSQIDDMDLDPSFDTSLDDIQYLVCRIEEETQPENDQHLPDTSNNDNNGSSVGDTRNPTAVAKKARAKKPQEGLELTKHN
jgi:hypothetical protein